jgi:hypothetical protein
MASAGLPPARWLRISGSGGTRVPAPWFANAPKRPFAARNAFKKVCPYKGLILFDVLVLLGSPPHFPFLVISMACSAFWLTGSEGEPMPVPEMSRAALCAMRFRFAALVYTCACEIELQPNQTIS